MKKTTLLVILSILYSTANIYCQGNASRKLDSKSRTEIVDKICTMLKEKYVLIELNEKICSALKSNSMDGKYDTILTPANFAAKLTNDIQSESKDLHLKVRFRKGAGKQLMTSDNSKPDPIQQQRFMQAIKNENFGFRIAQRLNGNIGYIDVREFLDTMYVKEAFASAVIFLQHTNAIIIDLRFNGGGDPACVQLLCSYFFSNTPVHLNDIYDRPKNETKQYWTLKEVEGKRLPDVPLYVLTSNYTFSAAEEFAYDLQSLRRATIVGDTTRGGANPGGTFAIDDDFTIFLPTGKAINPITKTNWETVGVIPDVSVFSEQSLQKAHLLAVQHMIEKSTDESDKKYFAFLAESIEGEMNPTSLCESNLKLFIGNYSDRNITYNSGKLYYQYGRRAKIQMTQISEDLFTLPDLDYVRLRFNKDKAGYYSSLTEITDTGDNETINKNK